MDRWFSIAARLVEGLNVQPGELIQVRDHVDRPDVLQAVLLAVDLAGATPILDHQSPAYLDRWLAAATPAMIEQSGRQRLRLLEQVDRAIVLAGGIPNFALAHPEVQGAWHELDAALTALEENRELPVLVVAVPNERRAALLRTTLAELEAQVLPACQIRAEQSRDGINRMRAAVAGDRILLRTGDVHLLHLYHGDRFWHSDDGVIDDADRQHKSIVSNLPAGSLYTTVVEEKTHGSLFLPKVQEATNVVLHFADGRIATIEATSGADGVAAWLDSHSGEPRRVSHLGIGLNPLLRRPIGWTIVDEHMAGAIFLALGENRYMGGQNASSLNHDFALFGASLEIDGRPIVEHGVLMA